MELHRLVVVASGADRFDPLRFVPGCPLCVFSCGRRVQNNFDIVVGHETSHLTGVAIDCCLCPRTVGTHNVIRGVCGGRVPGSREPLVTALIKVHTTRRSNGFIPTLQCPLSVGRLLRQSHAIIHLHAFAKARYAKSDWKTWSFTFGKIFTQTEDFFTALAGH